MEQLVTVVGLEAQADQKIRTLSGGQRRRLDVAIGPAYALAMEREDGTLLRAKAVPRGISGYVSGQVLYHSLGLIPSVLTILIPSVLLFDNPVHRGAAGWATVSWVLVLGLLATMPIGTIIGSLVPGVQKVGAPGACSRSWC